MKCANLQKILNFLSISGHFVAISIGQRLITIQSHLQYNNTVMASKIFLTIGTVRNHHTRNKLETSRVK